MPAVQKLFTLMVAVFSLSSVMAQKPSTPANRNAATQKAKPKLRAALGAYSDSAIVPVDEALKLLAQSLKITDDKNAVYTLVTYQVAYTRLGVTENEETGKVTPTSSMVAKQFNVTPVPESWARFVYEQLKPGEQLYFFDIVGKDAQGKLYFAPDLRIKTK